MQGSLEAITLNRRTDEPVALYSSGFVRYDTYLKNLVSLDKSYDISNYLGDPEVLILQWSGILSKY